MKSPLFNTLFKSAGAAGPSDDAVASSAARAAREPRPRLPLPGGAERCHGAGAAGAAAPQLRGPRRALHRRGRDAVPGIDHDPMEVGDGVKPSHFSYFFLEIIRDFGGFYWDERSVVVYIV